MIPPHSRLWYERLAQVQEGYHYPWKSCLEPGHGEDRYRVILEAELKAQDVVLDAGCGSGELTKDLARFCRRMVAYDRVESYIRKAREGAPDNTDFVLMDSKSTGLPAIPGGVDWIICSKGPRNWMEFAPALAKATTRMIMLVPVVGQTCPWDGILPAEFRSGPPNLDASAIEIRTRLESIGADLESLEICESTEWFDSPADYLDALLWGKFDLEIDRAELLSLVFRIFRSHGIDGCLGRPYHRLIWRSTLHGRL